MIFFYRFLLVIIVIEIKLIEPVHALSARDQKFVLDRHNLRRSQLSNGQTQNKTGMLPTATNIFTMGYDTNIETIAQKWANKCKFKHSGTKGNGENICMLGYKETYVAKALNICSNLWWNESLNKGVPKDLILTNSNWYPIGHFTQMAWWNTAKLGCGLAYCSEKKTFIVCQYNPPGNYIGQKIYESGPVCSKCPNPNDGKFHCQYGLCI